MSPFSRLLRIRWPLFLAVVAVCLLGIYNLESAARSTNPDLYLTQLIWLSLGMVTALLCSLINYRFTRYFAYLIYGVISFLLILTLVKGTPINGARRWINLGFMNLQASELMKVAIIITLAHYLSRHWVGKKMTLRELLRPLNISRPLAITAIIIFKLKAPFMLDPLGELARLTRKKLAAPPVPAEFLWFRITIILIIVALLATFITMRLIYARRPDLVNPVSKSAVRRQIILFSLVSLGLSLYVLFTKSPFMRDPVAYLLNTFYRESGPGGVYEQFTPHYWLPVILFLLSAIYLALCLLLIRARGWQTQRDLIAPIDIIALPALLILIEPDLGTTLIYLAIAGTMLLYSGVNGRSLAILCIAMVFGAGIAWMGILKDYQRQRITTFLDPEQDAKGSGYHSIQSLIAVGSGKLLGKGHGNGTQTQLRFLPEQHTDFAFSVWAEEMGFMGCLLLLFCYALLLALLLWTAYKAADAYGSLLCVGTAAFIFWHMVINIGMVTGLLPVVGVTLPFFSYGGSSLVTLWLTIGLALSVSIPERFFDGAQ